MGAAVVVPVIAVFDIHAGIGASAASCTQSGTGAVGSVVGANAVAVVITGAQPQRYTGYVAGRAIAGAIRAVTTDPVGAVAGEALPVVNAVDALIQLPHAGIEVVRDIAQVVITGGAAEVGCGRTGGIIVTGTNTIRARGVAPAAGRGRARIGAAELALVRRGARPGGKLAVSTVRVADGVRGKLVGAFAGAVAQAVLAAGIGIGSVQTTSLWIGLVRVHWATNALSVAYVTGTAIVIWIRARRNRRAGA